MDIGYLSFSMCLLQFLLSIYYRFQCTDLSPPSLKIFLNILMFDAIMSVFLGSFSCSSNNFWVVSSGFYMWKIMSSVNKDNFTSFFLFTLYVFSSLLIALARTFHTGDSRHPILFLILEEKHLTFHHWVWY